MNPVLKKYLESIGNMNTVTLSCVVREVPNVELRPINFEHILDSKKTAVVCSNAPPPYRRTPPPLKNAILGAKTNAELIAALRAVKGEDEWEEQPDLYDW